MLLALAALLPACSADFFITQVIATPNLGREIDVGPEASRRALSEMEADRFLRVTVGPPVASIGAWIFEPPQYPVRGTVLVLHGVADGPFWMRSKAQALAKHGYRAVLVGLRGYGASSGALRGFGIHERHDLVQLVDALDRCGLLEGGLGVWGMSYGGAVAIMYAGQDPRVGAVVAVGAFAAMRPAVSHAMCLFFPFCSAIRDEQQRDLIVDCAAGISEIDADDASAEIAITRTTAPVLLVHGEWDSIVPIENGERLHAAAPDHSVLERLPSTGHFGSWWDLDGRVEALTMEWFDRHLAGAPPASRLPSPGASP